MLGNIIGLFGSVESGFRKVFDSQWNKSIKRIRSMSPGDLEEMDSEIRHMQLLYDLADMKNIISSDRQGYYHTLQRLRSDQAEIILKRFRINSKKIDVLLGNHAAVSDPVSESSRFDEAFTQFRMLKAFYSRWRLDNPIYCSYLHDADFPQMMKSVAFRMARKRKLLMEEKLRRSKIIDYSNKTQIFAGVDAEVDRLLDWYGKNYLNLEAGTGSRVVVDYLTVGDSSAPLEALKKVPSDMEISNLSLKLREMIDFCLKKSFVDPKDLLVLEDYGRLLDLSMEFSLDSDDSSTRFKAVVFDRLLSIHRMLDDARSRQSLSVSRERDFARSFAMYLAPVSELLSSAKDGFISSEGKSIVLEVNAEIKPGSACFVFPLTRLCEDKHFAIVRSGDRDSVHLFSKDGSSMKIDLSQGFFLAPADAPIHFDVGSSRVSMSSGEYFKRFFSSLPKGSRTLPGRNFFLYSDEDLAEISNFLCSKDLSKSSAYLGSQGVFSQIPGKLTPTDRTEKLEFEEFSESSESDTRERLVGKSRQAVTLFEWKKIE